MKGEFIFIDGKKISKDKAKYADELYKALQDFLEWNSKGGLPERQFCYDQAKDVINQIQGK